MQVQRWVLLAASAACISAARADAPLWVPFPLDTALRWLPADGVRGSPAVATSGRGFLAAWQDRRNGTWDIYAALLTARGAPRESVAFPVSVADSDQTRPSVCFDGTNYVVLWEDIRGRGRWSIYGCRVDTLGRVLDPGGVAIRLDGGDKHCPAIARGRSATLAVWDEYCGSRNIVGAVLDSTLAVERFIEVTVSPGTEGRPAVAAGDSGFLVVWEDRPLAASQVRAARLDTAGNPVDSAAILLHPDVYSQEFPAVAWNDTRYLVVWSEAAIAEQDIYGIRVGASGAVLDTAAIRVSAGPGAQRRPDVRRWAGGWLAVWEDTRDSATRPDVYGARVTAGGVLLDTNGIALAASSGSQTAPAIAVAESTLCLAWQDIQTDTLRQHIYAARSASPYGSLETLGVHLAVRPYAYRQVDPDVAAGDANCLVVWRDFRDDSSAADLYGIRLAPSGARLDSAPFPVSRAPGGQDSVALDSDGEGYLAVWLDRRTGRYQLYGARIASSGEVLDTGGVLLCTRQCAGLRSPGVSYGDTAYLVVWQEYVTGRQSVYGTLVTRGGAVLFPGGFRISNPSLNALLPAVDFGRGNHLVTWCRSGGSPGYFDVYGARVSASGTVLDTLPLQLSRLAGHDLVPAVGAGPDGFLVGWGNDSSGVRTARAARVTYEGVLVDTAALMLSPGRGLEAGVDVAADGSGWTAAWTSADSAAASVRCATLSLSGHIADTLAVWSRGTPEAVRVVGLGQGRSLVVYSAAAETLRGRPSGARRIWAADIYSTAGLAGRQVCQREGLSVGPNPAAGDVRIEFAVRPAGRVLLRLYDASGREVRTLCDAVSQAGDRSFIWSGRDDAGRVCPQGIYFLQLQTDSYRSRKKVVLAR